MAEKRQTIAFIGGSGLAEGLKEILGKTTFYPPATTSGAAMAGITSASSARPK